MRYLIIPLITVLAFRIALEIVREMSLTYHYRLIAREKRVARNRD